MPTSMVRHDHLNFIEIKAGAWDQYSVRRHSHDELQIGFVERGSSKITCKTLAFEMTAGQAILIPPKIIHLCRPDEEGKFKFTILYINPHWFETAFNINVNRLKPQTARFDLQSLADKDRFIASLQTGTDPLVLESDAIIFLGDVILNRFDLHLAEEPLLKHQNRLAKVHTYITRHFQDQIQLDDLAQMAGMTKFSLLRRFKSRYKLPPHAFLVNQRINYAKQLLLEGNTVAQTAVTCGFFDQSHFVKTFRQYVGIPPINYK